MRARADAIGRPFEDVKSDFTSSSALNRMATEPEVANMARFLCGPAGTGVTGQTINVNCGSFMN